MPQRDQGPIFTLNEHSDIKSIQSSGVSELAKIIEDLNIFKASIHDLTAVIKELSLFNSELRKPAVTFAAPPII